jgi:outer membrane protein assembly factor BamA
VRYGIGLNTAEALNAEGTWTSRNFSGGARRLEVRGKISNVAGGPLAGIPFMETKRGKYAKLNGSLSIDFLQPWFFGPTNTLGLGVYVQRQSFPGVFVQTSEGAYVTFNRSLGPGTNISFGYRPELTAIDADDARIFCENLTVCDQATQSQDIKVLSSPHWLAPLTVSFARDHSNSLFMPTSGSILRVDGEFAARGTASDFSYWRLVAELAEYRELLPGVVLALRARPGFVKALSEATAGLGVHPQKRFFAGGPNSVRGFAQYQLGPKVLTVDAARFLWQDSTANPPRGICSLEAIQDGSCDASSLGSGAFDVRPVGGGSILEGNFELRFPLAWSRLHGAAFMDYGQLFTTPADFRLRGLVWTPGVGVRYISAIGPIRVDVGYRPQGQQGLSVLTTEVGGASVNGQCVGDPDPTRPGGIVDCGQLHALRKLVEWPKGNTFLDHLQLHFSIGQAF